MEKSTVIIILVVIISLLLVLGSIAVAHRISLNSNEVVETTVTIEGEEYRGYKQVQLYYRLSSPDFDCDFIVEADTKLSKMIRESDTWTVTIQKATLPFKEYYIKFSNGYATSSRDELIIK